MTEITRLRAELATPRSHSRLHQGEDGGAR